MEVSLFLAKVIGLCFVIFAISIFLARSNYQASLKDFNKHPATVLLAGTIYLIIGILIIISHNIWTLDWRIIITIVGWLSLIRGIIWTTFPSIIRKGLSKFSDSRKPIYFSAIIVFIFGIILCYFGF